MSEILSSNMSDFFFFLNSKWCQLSLKLERGSHLCLRKLNWPACLSCLAARLSDQKKSLPYSSGYIGVCFNHALHGGGGTVKTQCHSDRIVSVPGKQQCLYLNQLCLLGPSCLHLNPTVASHVTSWKWEDLGQEMPRWLSGQQSKPSAETVLAFSSSSRIVPGNPALWQSVQTSENGVGIL